MTSEYPKKDELYLNMREFNRILIGLVPRIWPRIWSSVLWREESVLEINDAELLLWRHVMPLSSSRIAVA
eukprot:SM000413S15650  [mRNA]  locus=s413:16913:17431:- [translate_table: standard]